MTADQVYADVSRKLELAQQGVPAYFTGTEKLIVERALKFFYGHDTGSQDKQVLVVVGENET